MPALRPRRQLAHREVHAVLDEAVECDAPDSSFNDETMRLVEEGAPMTPALNLALTVVGGVMAGWLGLITAREMLGR